MHEIKRDALPKPYSLHWGLYGLIALLSGGLYTLWVSFRLTQRTCQIETRRQQRWVLCLTWLVGWGCLAVFLLAAICYEDDRLYMVLPLVLCCRFAWTFALRKSLYRYYAQEHHRHFLPDGFLLLFTPVMLTLATLQTVERAPVAHWSEDPIDRYHQEVCLHPALYSLINVLTLSLYGSFTMYDLTVASRADDEYDKKMICDMWIFFIAYAIGVIGYFILVDDESSYDTTRRTGTLFVGAMSFIWSLKLRRLMIVQFHSLYGLTLKINRLFLLLFPCVYFLYIIRRLPRQYEMHKQQLASVSH